MKEECAEIDKMIYDILLDESNNTLIKAFNHLTEEVEEFRQAIKRVAAQCYNDEMFYEMISRDEDVAFEMADVVNMILVVAQHLRKPLAQVLRDCITKYKIKGITKGSKRSTIIASMIQERTDLYKS